MTHQTIALKRSRTRILPGGEAMFDLAPGMYRETITNTVYGILTLATVRKSIDILSVLVGIGVSSPVPETP